MKLVKAALALLLLPAFAATWIFATRLFQSLSLEVHLGIPLVVFLLGISTWILIHYLFPRPTWFYVFGHEVTHAAAVLLSGGKVSDFHVSGEGGHVVADRTSAFIALSPYLIPFYPLVLGLLWGLLLYLLPGVQTYTILFLSIWGMSWGFHLSFTASLLRQGQTDFESQGYFFSWVVILLCNAWIILALAYFWLQPFSPMEALAHLFQSFQIAYEVCWQGLQTSRELFN